MSEIEGKDIALLYFLEEWLNSVIPTLSLPIDIKEDELRARLNNGTVLCQLLNKLQPGSVNVAVNSDHSVQSRSENVKRFLAALDRLGLPRFETSDLEQQGSMKAVVDCLLKLRAKSLQNALGNNISVTNLKSDSPRGNGTSRVHFSTPSVEEHRKVSSDSKFQRILRSPLMAEPSAALIYHIGHKFHDVFQLKQGSYVDLPAAKISEMMKSNSLDNAPTQSLLSVVNCILDESVERRNGEIPHRVACLLRKVVQEIERRISTQSEHIRTQNNLFKTREEKFQSRIRVLEALASGTKDESEIVASQIQQLKTEKTKVVEEKKADGEDVIKLKKEQEDRINEISMLKEELETTKRTYELRCSQLEEKKKTVDDKDVSRLMTEQEDRINEISMLKQELETTKRSYESRCSQLDEKKTTADDKDVNRLMKELEDRMNEISMLKQELETTKRSYELRCSQMDDKKTMTADDTDVSRLMKEQEDRMNEISMLKQELETTKRSYELRCSQLEEKNKTADDKDINRLIKEKEDRINEISMLKQELETTRRSYELRCSQFDEKKMTADDKDVVSQMKEQEDRINEISMLKQELETTKRTCALQCSKLEEKKKADEEDINRLMKEKDERNIYISNLKQELETTKREYELRLSELEEKKGNDEDTNRLMKEHDGKNNLISVMKQELETTKKEYELRLSELEEKKKVNDEDTNRLMKEHDDKNNLISVLKQELETVKREYELRLSELEEKNKVNEEDTNRLMKEHDDKNNLISVLKQELETTKREHELRSSELEERNKANEEDTNRLMKEHEDKNNLISVLKEELETTRSTYELRCSQLEAEVKGSKEELKHKSKEYECLLEDLRSKVKELEALVVSNNQKYNMERNQIRNDVNCQFSSLQKIKVLWESIKQDVVKEKKIYLEECNKLGVNLKIVVNAAEKYHDVLAENRKMFNELQELKGNIRVFCRVRPFIPGQKEKKSIVDHIDEDDLVVANPAKQGKDALRSFKFNKVYGPATTQVQVYNDIQPFIRSVLDGFNVCIFAYGQTGSGKTYTMSGPDGATSETWGVNYRALNDLFSMSSSRTGSISYEVGAQIVEIYNEQVRDLLSSDSSQKKLGITTNSQNKGLAVPDASMFPVKSPSDVLELMEFGLKNRAMSATAMNERSSRSHSVVSIHVRGTDLKSGSALHGNLHLVDLAGSERVDRSEVTGDRLREAQHINKSLSALGDVIFALSQKSSHVPYRNSKLTQLLQSALGGHAKTIMFVQVNPDANSFSETLSTLKFAERVSGIELGAAKSNKDQGRDVRELMEQVASLKDTISTKDEEIERLQLLKELKNANSERRGGTASLRVAEEDIGQNIDADADDDERLSDISQSDVSGGAEADDSSDNTTLAEGKVSSDNLQKLRAVTRVVKALQKSSSSVGASSKESSPKASSLKRTPSSGQLKVSRRLP